MRRSELVQKYTAILKMYGYVDNDLMSAEGLATVLLGVAENNGMPPPAINILPYSYNRNDGTMGFEVNEWEEELDVDDLLEVLRHD